MFGMRGVGIKQLVLGLFFLWRLEILFCLPVDTSCPLDFGSLDFTEVISACLAQDRSRCCRFVNAIVGVSMSQYVNATGQLAVPSSSSEACLNAISNTLQSNGLSSNVTVFCGLGTKITVNFQCKGRTNTKEMEGTPKFKEVLLSCVKPVSAPETCKKCLDASFTFLHNLLDMEDNITLSICRDATFVTIASYGDLEFAVDKAICFFGVQGLEGQSVIARKTMPFPQAPSAAVSSSPSPSPSPSPTPKYPSPTAAHSNIAFIKEIHSSSRLALILGIGTGITGGALALLFLLILLIHRKREELKYSEGDNLSPWDRATISSPSRKFQKWRKGPSSMFRRFSHKEIRRATDDFSTIIGKGGFGTVYKARFKDGLVAAVKRMNKVSQQDEFCKEMELLGRLHHRHLVTLIGFCAEQRERFLIYEYMENGSLKEHLHASTKTPLNWQIRVQIAIDVATALEYLHFYCDPPLCHRDIKSSNILLDENFIAKVSDFGLAYAAPSGANNFEPVNTDVRGTPGYMDPEYLVTQELTEKSDVYSYGVLLLELITAREAVHENKNLVEWAQKYILDECRLCQMVDPDLENTCNFEELKSLVSIVKMCTQREGKSRPSIRQVLRLLYDRLDILSPNPSMAVVPENEDDDNNELGMNKQKIRVDPSTNGNDFSGEIRCIQSPPNTSSSVCSRSLILESTSPCSSL